MDPQFQAASDEELARESQAGSSTAFEELVYRYEGRVYGFVWNCCRNSETAREITQDAFVRAFQALAQFDPRRPFAAWLFAIARRKVIDYQRAISRVEQPPPPEEPDLNDPAELLAARDDRERLWGLARSHLPSAQFQALWLRYAEGMSVADVASALGKTRVHVKVLLFRARRSLAGRLARAGSNEFREVSTGQESSEHRSLPHVNRMLKPIAPV